MKNLRLNSLVLLLCVAVAVSAKNPKYIFYFIGDGMGLGHVLTTETYNRTVLNNPEHITMLQFPVASVATSYSANRKVTDSAAAGTALSTGKKTNNYMLGVTPDSLPCYSVAKELKEAGYGVAIATTVPIDDATPGAFYTHVPNRSMYYPIALDLAHSGYDMFAGAILHTLDNKDGKKAEVLKELKKNGYTLAIGTEEFEKKKKKADKILLLNRDNGLTHVGFTIDSIKGNLQLPYITQACLDHMKRVSPDKFFMMIEGGNIDWAAHANDAGATVKEILNFDQSIAIAYEFYKQHPDETLILVTADHNTGGMSLGVNGGPKDINLKNFDYQKVSIEGMQRATAEMMKRSEPVTWEEMQEYLKENTGLYGPIKVSKKQDKAIREKFESTFVKRDTNDTKTLYATYSQFVAEVFSVLDHCTGIGWTTTSHAGDFTPVFAVGCGAEIFGGLNDNTDLPRKLRELTRDDD